MLRRHLLIPLLVPGGSRMLQTTTALPSLSVVAPCFNEAAVLPEFHARMSAAARAASGGRYELVLVNDGSRDATWAVMQALAASDPHVVAVNLSRNHGHQLALTAGLSVCRGTCVLIIDADLQDPPELLPPMMARIEAGADVVYGRRRARAGETAFKRTSARLFYRVLRRLVDVDIPADTGDFRLMRRRALDVLNAMPEQFRFIRGMVSWIGLRQEALDYDRAPRAAGATHYPLLRMLRLATDAVTSFSIVPLRAASAFGLMLGAVGMAMLAYTLGSWALGEVVSGWTSLATIVLIIGSAQLLVLGVFGEYLGRLYMEAKRRPLFVIESVVGGAAEFTLGAQAKAAVLEGAAAE
jgi:dolichol-phosphate mannosyltransferase